MLQKPSFYTTWLPLGLSVVALAILNIGLYTRLASQPAPPRFEFPYYEDFSALAVEEYEAFGGDWAIRDEALVQLSTSGYDLMSFVSIDIEPEQPYSFQTTLRYLGGTMGGGLIFNAQQITSRQKSHMARFNVDAGELWLIYGYFGDDSDFVGQGSTPLPLAPDDTEPHQLRVRVEGDTYALFLNDAPVVREVPLVYWGGAVGFISATSQVAFDDVSVADATTPSVVQQPTTAEPVETSTVQLTETFDGGEGISLWQPISGDWQPADGAYVQSQTDGFDLSTIYQKTFTYPLILRTTFHHQIGAGGGLLFNLPAGDSKNGGHMVRYFEDGGVVAWGYFDAGGVFNGQGSVAVSLPDTMQTLAIQADGQTYTIVLNGAELAAGIPIVDAVESGHIGLTASQSAVAFDRVEIGTLGDQPAMSANIDAESANGDWIVEGGTITQRDTGNADFIAGTGLAGERFTISTEITLPADNPEAGAGIVFHMDERNDPGQGYMVRLGSGGQELFWGRYDAEGVFSGLGGIPLEVPERYELLLVVREGSFDIQLNGTTIVEAISLERSSGWIGLISFSGPVIFNNVSLQLGE